MTRSPGPQAAAQPRLTPPRLDFFLPFFFFFNLHRKTNLFFLFFSCYSSVILSATCSLVQS